MIHLINETASHPGILPVQSKGTMKIGRDFYLKDTFEVAEGLLGASLHTRIGGRETAGRIVELEVYLGPRDKASHAFGGKRTERTEVMYRAGGTSYIYLIYGMYYMFNVVTSPEGIPHAILIRALEPVKGVEIMKERRGTEKMGNLTSGPGKLCSALDLTRKQNGLDLTGKTVWISKPDPPVNKNRIATAPRVGIGYAEEFIQKPWRFYIKGNPHVSKV